MRTLVTLKGNERACLWTEPLWGIPYNLYLPFASVYMAALGLNPVEIGTVSTVFFASQMVWALLSGPLTDKLGRRLCTVIFDILSWSVPSLLWMCAQNYWWFLAAAIFNLRQLCITWFIQEIHVDRLFTASISKFCLVTALFFIFRYINYLVRSSWSRYRRKHKNKDFNATLARNIIALLIWGIYIIAVFLMLHVPGTGIAIVTGGLSTGMGFASKSLLENFFYGISLMSGRVRVGDYIECDGMIGKVESITYQSTQITTLDGSVVAILNSDLFSKNFKNLTRNHQYERIAIPFGVSYGTNVEEVRRLIVEGIKSICKKTPDGRDIVTQKHPILVAFSDFGASSVDLLLVVWVLVDQRISFTAQAKEKIYQVLNDNHIEIPFPQQDIYIRSITNSEQN